MRAAGAGTIVTSTRLVSGRCPGMIADTITGTFPGAPDVRSPVESTRASNCPPARKNLGFTPGMGFPAESRTCAVRRRVSLATMRGVAGVTTMRALGCWAWSFALGAKLAKHAPVRTSKGEKFANRVCRCIGGDRRVEIDRRLQREKVDATGKGVNGGVLAKNAHRQEARVHSLPIACVCL